LDLREQIDLGDVEQGAAFGGHARKPKAKAVLVRIGDLFGAGMFKVIGQGGLACAGN
jgi:hypothetical protein